MKKLLTLCCEDCPNCSKTADYIPRYFVEREYSDEAYRTIRSEADQYEIYIYSTWGHDYGYGAESSSTSENSKEIEDHQILVTEDGKHFAGVVNTSDYYSYNKVSSIESGLHTALIDDPVDRFKGYPLIAKSGSSFSSDDHEKWDFTYYYLRKK